ncbi:hypothetical protein BC830DRAFT_586613 [Chytriomyces sp. MP71]|nr:hypothetical protein BC830DRAFT_586613 [Chytriomyces sp. MP71]
MIDPTAPASTTAEVIGSFAAASASSSGADVRILLARLKAGLGEKLSLSSSAAKVSTPPEALTSTRRGQTEPQGCAESRLIGYVHDEQTGIDPAAIQPESRQESELAPTYKTQCTPCILGNLYFTAPLSEEEPEGEGELDHLVTTKTTPVLGSSPPPEPPQPPPRLRIPFYRLPRHQRQKILVNTSLACRKHSLTLPPLQSKPKPLSLPSISRLHLVSVSRPESSKDSFAPCSMPAQPLPPPPPPPPCYPPPSKMKQLRAQIRPCSLPSHNVLVRPPYPSQQHHHVIGPSMSSAAASWDPRHGIAMEHHQIASASRCNQHFPRSLQQPTRFSSIPQYPNFLNQLLPPTPPFASPQYYSQISQEEKQLGHLPTQRPCYNGAQFHETLKPRSLPPIKSQRNPRQGFFEHDSGNPSKIHQPFLAPDLHLRSFTSDDSHLQNELLEHKSNPCSMIHPPQKQACPQQQQNPQFPQQDIMKHMQQQLKHLKRQHQQGDHQQFADKPETCSSNREIHEPPNRAMSSISPSPTQSSNSTETNNATDTEATVSVSPEPTPQIPNETENIERRVHKGKRKRKHEEYGPDNPPPRYTCEVPGCDRVFSSKPHVRRHLLNHNLEKNEKFFCPVEECTKRFVRKDHWLVHLRRCPKLGNASVPLYLGHQVPDGLGLSDVGGVATCSAWAFEDGAIVMPNIGPATMRDYINDEGPVVSGDN